MEKLSDRKVCGAYVLRNVYDVSASCGRKDGEEGPWSVHLSGDWECPLLRVIAGVSAALAVFCIVKKCVNAIRKRRLFSEWKRCAERKAAERRERREHREQPGSGETECACRG